MRWVEMHDCPAWEKPAVRMSRAARPQSPSGSMRRSRRSSPPTASRPPATARLRPDHPRTDAVRGARHKGWRASRLDVADAGSMFVAVRDLAPDIVRQRLLIEGYFSADVDEAMIREFFASIT